MRPLTKKILPRGLLLQVLPSRHEAASVSLIRHAVCSPAPVAQAIASGARQLESQSIHGDRFAHEATSAPWDHFTDEIKLEADSLRAQIADQQRNRALLESILLPWRKKPCRHLSSSHRARSLGPSYGELLGLPWDPLRGDARFERIVQQLAETAH